MLEDPRAERVCEEVELVRGTGDPLLGQLCVMSFVAYLAGESHTDRPRCASPVIRSMAVLVNDQMPSATRQRLKVFAPRIIGTRDGFDDARARMLGRAVHEEILPRADREMQQRPAPDRARGRLGRLWTRLAKRALVGRITAGLTVLAAGTEDDRVGELQERIAEATAHLLALCARDAPTDEDEAWYWDEAIGLLDRLCDIGAENRAAQVQPERLQELGRILDARRSETGPLRNDWAGPFDFGFLFPGITATDKGRMGSILPES